MEPGRLTLSLLLMTPGSDLLLGHSWRADLLPTTTG